MSEAIEGGNNKNEITANTADLKSNEKRPILASYGSEDFHKTVLAFKSILTGEDIDKADHCFSIGENHEISLKSLKHIIEHRGERDEDLELLLERIPYIIANPLGSMPNNNQNDYPGSFLIGEIAPGKETKAIILVMSSDGRSVINGFFKRARQFIKGIKKEQSPTVGEAPSGSSPGSPIIPLSGNRSERRLSDLQQQDPTLS